MRKDGNGQPDEDDLGGTLAIISAMKFPPAEAVQFLIMRELQSFVGTRAQLAWLNDVLLKRVTEWPGLPQLRALFCSRFASADGDDPTSIDTRGPRISCTVPGFTPEELAAGSQAAESHLAIAAADVKLLPGEVSQDEEIGGMFLALAKAKAMPGTASTRKNSIKRIREALS